MASCQFGAKPLPEPMLTCQLDLWEQILVKYESKYNKFSHKIMHVQCCLWISHRFVLGSVSQMKQKCLKLIWRFIEKENIQEPFHRNTTKIHNDCRESPERQIWGIWKLRPAYSPETPNLGQNRWCFVPCDLEIWWMTLENNRASLLCCFKLCVTFHSHR